MQTITLRRSSRAAERITYRRFSRRATRPLAAAVVCPIFFAISDMLSTSLRSRYARRKYCGNETLPGASSLDRYSKKQRCISKMMWESRSASPRVSFVGISANAVTCPVFKAIKARNRHVTCQSCLAGLECGDVSPLSKRRHACALQMQRDLIQSQI